MSPRHVLVAGGAGFVGSNIANRLVAAGHVVTVLDGFVSGTGGRRENLDGIAIARLIDARLEDLHELPELLQDIDAVVDCVGWTAHQLAIEDPFHDLELNLRAHLVLMRALRERPQTTVVYLGSRSQYGANTADPIRESDCMIPQDVQGIHKAAAESHYRVFSNLYALPVVALRFPACFGENQPTHGADIGLIGSFIQKALEGGAIEVYGTERRRSFVYAPDLAGVVDRLVRTQFQGFIALNLAGTQVRIDRLAQLVVGLVGRGRVVSLPMPNRIAAIDMGNARLDEASLSNTIGHIPRSELESALANTVAYFKGQLNDLAV